MQERLLSSGAEEEGDLKGRVLVESKKIWRVAFPSMISRVSSFGTIVVTQSFIGHISSVDLAGYALVQTLLVRFVNGILVMHPLCKNIYLVALICSFFVNAVCL